MSRSVNDNFDNGGVPLVLGSIFGYRVWEVVEGKLHSPQQSFAWHEGEQVSRCANGDRGRTYKTQEQVLRELIPAGSQYEGFTQEYVKHEAMLRISYSFADYAADSDEPETFSMAVKRDDLSSLMYENRDKDHMVHCSCGFYAYTHGSNEFDNGKSTQIVGIIEGYGVTFIGTKGFRCQKAKLIALAPNRSFSSWWNTAPSERLNGWDDVVKNYPSVKTFRSYRAMTKKYPPSRLSDFRHDGTLAQ